MKFSKKLIPSMKLFLLKALMILDGQYWQMIENLMRYSVLNFTKSKIKMTQLMRKYHKLNFNLTNSFHVILKTWTHLKRKRFEMQNKFNSNQIIKIRLRHLINQKKLIWEIHFPWVNHLRIDTWDLLIQSIHIHVLGK